MPWAATQCYNGFGDVVRSAYAPPAASHSDTRLRSPDRPAIGLRQLARLDGFLARRAALAERYFERFPRIPGAILPPSQMPRQSWNMFCVLFPFAERGMDRKTFRDRLHERGITTGVSYEALHTTTLGRSLGYRDGDFPNAERIGRETLSLPLHVALSNDDVDYVCRTITEIWESPDERKRP